MIKIILHFRAPATVTLDHHVSREEVHVESVVAVIILVGGREDLVTDAWISATLGGHGVSHGDVIAATGLVNILVGLVVRVTVRTEYERLHLQICDLKQKYFTRLKGTSVVRNQKLKYTTKLLTFNIIHKTFDLCAL